MYYPACCEKCGVRLCYIGVPFGKDQMFPEKLNPTCIGCAESNSSLQFMMTFDDIEAQKDE
jgi:hypothetical protein